MSEEPPVSSPRDWMTGILVPVTCVVLGAALSLLGAWLWDTHVNGLRNLSYDVASSTVSGADVGIWIGGKDAGQPDKRVPGLTVVSVGVFNRTGKDFGPTTILLKFALKPRADGKGFEPEHFAQNASDPLGAPISPTKFGIEGTDLVAEYDLPQVRRSSPEAGPSGDFHLLSVYESESEHIERRPRSVGRGFAQ